MIDLVTWWWFECRICGFDSDEADHLADVKGKTCPLCAEDCGHDNLLTYRPATAEEIERLMRKDK